jgi:hypothetical protein
MSLKISVVVRGCGDDFAPEDERFLDKTERHLIFVEKSAILDITKVNVQRISRKCLIDAHLRPLDGIPSNS